MDLLLQGLIFTLTRHLVHKIHDDVLLNISELLSKEIKAADVFSVWLVANTDGDRLAGGKVQIVNGHVGSGFCVDRRTAFTDFQRDQSAILRTSCIPPIRIEPAEALAKVTGAAPCAAVDPVEPYGDVRWPILLIVERL